MRTEYGEGTEEADTRLARIAGKGESLTKAIRISDDAIWDFV